jgi:glycine/D-amino acid oxidase-like deaminating enzyme
MLKVRPAPGFRLPGSVMSDLSLVRYLGYAELPEAAALRARLDAEQPELLEHGIHLIVVQGADGDLVVGDTHHNFWSPPPFSREALDDMMLAEMHAVLNLPGAHVVERWSGTYATLPDRLMIREAPLDGVRLVIVTSGTGASTAFAIAEETLAELFEEALQ